MKTIAGSALVLSARSCACRRRPRRRRWWCSAPEAPRAPTPAHLAVLRLPVPVGMVRPLISASATSAATPSVLLDDGPGVDYERPTGGRAASEMERVTRELAEEPRGSWTRPAMAIR